MAYLRPVSMNQHPIATIPFKDIKPGLVHIEIKYLEQMPDEKLRCN